MNKININDPESWSQLDWDEQPQVKIKSDQAVAIARSNRLTKTTKESIAIQTEKNRKLAKDPNWLESTAKKNKELAQDPKWIESTHRGSEKRKLRGKKLIEQGKIEEFRKLFGVKDKHSVETRQQMSSSAKQRWAKQMKPVVALGKQYENIYEAGKALNIHKDTVVYRIKTRPHEYHYVD